MRTFSEGQRGVVRIGCVDMGIALLTNAIVALRSERPDLQFSLHQGDPLYLEELLERRQIDAALVHLPLTLNTSDVASRVLQQLVRQGVALALVPSLADALPEAGMLALDVPQLDAAADRLALIYHQQHAESAVLKPLLACFS